MKKFSIITLIIFMFTINIMPVFADSYKLNIEKESSDIKYLENDQGYISKKIINSNPEAGEVTVELEVSNKSQNKETQVTVKENAEIVIVLDESGSMLSTIDHENNLNRYQVVVSAANELINNILSNSTTAKIGTVSFAKDALVTQTLTSDKTLLANVYANGRLDNIGATTYTARGLEKAETLFSNADTAKIIILLTDGSPSDSTDTKNKLNELQEKGYSIITMLSDNSSVSSSVYGTTENPTVGKLYLIGDSEISTIIKDNIFSDVMEIIKKNDSITNVSITDYFPEDISDNFQFSYVTKPTTGTVSETISENNTITYTLDELKGNESVKIAYKLKLKEMNDNDLLDKVISTNEKVVLNYTDINTTDYEVILTSSPSIKLVKIEEQKNVEQAVENPPTGLYFSIGILVTLSVSIIGLLISKNKNYFSKI